MSSADKNVPFSIEKIKAQIEKKSPVLDGGKRELLLLRANKFITSYNEQKEKQGQLVSRWKSTIQKEADRQKQLAEKYHQETTLKSDTRMKKLIAEIGALDQKLVAIESKNSKFSSGVSTFEKKKI
jgi:predicted  nucleic acid-binding Zn-ribbon protein